MLNCPHCHQPMQQDPNNPEKVLCYTCRKRFDAAKVAEWQAAAAYEASMARESVQSPQDPFAYIVPPQQSQQQYGQPARQPATQLQIQTPPAYQEQSYDPAYIYGEQPGTKLSRGCAIASLILGIVALLNSWLPIINTVSVLLGLIALILGIVALRKVKKGTGAGKGVGIAGILTSIIGIVLSIAVSAMFIIGVTAAMDEASEHTADEYMNEITSELGNELDSYGGIVDDGYNDLSPWTDLEFSINGKTYTLMKSTLADLAESGYTLDLEGQGYPDGYIVEAGQMISVIELEGENDYEEYFIVNVANLTEEPMDIMDCVLTKLDYDNAGESQAVSISGISCGATPEEVVEVFGEPQDSEENDPYVLYQYETRKYTKYFQVIFADGVAKGFTLSSMEY